MAKSKKKEEKKMLTRVEYFDDRFYKMTIPNDDRELYKHVPLNLVNDRMSEVDIYLPSVTTIINNAKPNSFLATWRGDVGNREADRRIAEALEKGSIIHDCCEKLCKGWDIVYQSLYHRNPTDEQIAKREKEKGGHVYVTHDQGIQIQVARFEKLLNVLNPEIIDIERNVYYAKELMYAGTVDYVMKLEGGEYQITSAKTEKIKPGYYVVDLKTGKTADDSYFSQLAPYVKAYSNENPDIKLTGAILVHLNSSNKTGIEGIKVTVKENKDLAPYFEKFTNYYNVFVSDVPKSPAIFDIPTIIEGRKYVTTDN